MHFDVKATAIKILLPAHFLTTVPAFAGWTIDHQYNTVIETSENGDIEFHFEDPKIKLKDLKFQKINRVSEIPNAKPFLDEVDQKLKKENFPSSSPINNILCTENKKQGSFSIFNKDFVNKFQFSYPRYLISSSGQSAVPNIDFHARDPLFFNDLDFCGDMNAERTSYATTNNLTISMQQPYESKAIENMIDSLRFNNLIATETPAHLQSSSQVFQVLESYGVPLAVLMKYGPKGLDGLPYFRIPEKDMEVIITELASEVDFNSGSAEEALKDLANKAKSYASEKFGTWNLNLLDQATKVHFPIGYVMSKVFGKKSESLSGTARRAAIDAALLLVSEDANTLGWYQRGGIPQGNSMEKMNHLIDKQRHDLIQKALSQFTDSDEGLSTDLDPRKLAQDLITRFQAKLAPFNSEKQARPWTRDYPYAYYFAQHALQFKDNTDQLELAKQFLQQVKPNDKNPALPELDLYQEAQNTLVRLYSEQVHKKYADAKTDQEKCHVIELYLNQVQAVPSFPQNLLNDTASKLAFGPWGEGPYTPHRLDFDLKLEKKSTCANLLFHWARQAKTNAELQGHTPGSVYENHIQGKTLISDIAQAIHLLAQANQENQKLAGPSSGSSNCNQE